MEKTGNILMQKYDFGRLLGQGNFAKVYYGRNLATGGSVAIKVIDKEKVLKVGLINQTKREISVMGFVKHPNVLRLYEVMATKTKIYFVMEYAKGGELFAKVAKGRLKEDVARKYFQQLISAVYCCHSHDVYHRDLKPENLLLDENGNLKVSDFGLSAMAESKRLDGLLHTTCGTPAYVAPEVISRKGYDGVKADIWSCGVVLFVLLAGHLPFHHSNLMEMYRKISRAEYKFPNWFSSDIRRLLSRILDPNPNTRISMAKIMDNPWFKKGWDGEFVNMDNNNDNPTLSTAIDDTSTVLDMKLEVKKPNYFNAFDIISLSTGFDLSGLFVAYDQKEEVQFTSKVSAESIITKFESISESLNLKVMKKDGGFVKLEGPSSIGLRNMVLCIDVEIFEIAADFHLVEVKRSGGDSLDYRKMLIRDIKPALNEIVWTWHGEQHNY